MEENVSQETKEIPAVTAQLPESNTPQRNPKKIKIIISLLLMFLLLGSAIFFMSSRTRQESSEVSNKTAATKEQQAPSAVPTFTPPTIAIHYTEASTIAPKHLRGKILYEHNGVILAVDSAGKNPAIVAEGDKIGYAGWSHNGERVYYTTLENNRFTLHQKHLPSGAITILLSFDGSNKNIEFYAGNAAVRPQGDYVLYSAQEDIHLYHIETKKDSTLLVHKDCQSNNGSNIFNFVVRPVYGGFTDCYGYYFPKWSPDGDKAVIRKILYEGAVQVIISPLANDIMPRELTAGGEPSWSHDSERLTLNGGGYGPGSLFLFTNVTKPVMKDVFEQNKDFNKRAAAASNWSKDGKVVVVYDYSDKGIAIYNPATNTLSDLIALPDKHSSTDVQWAPDNKTIIYTQNGALWILNSETKATQQLPIAASSLLDVISE